MGQWWTPQWSFPTIWVPLTSWPSRASLQSTSGGSSKRVVGHPGYLEPLYSCLDFNSYTLKKKQNKKTNKKPILDKGAVFYKNISFISTSLKWNIYTFYKCFSQFVVMTLQKMPLPAWSLCYGSSKKMENWKNNAICQRIHTFNRHFNVHFLWLFVKCHLFLFYINVKTIFLLISRLYMLILAKQCGNTWNGGGGVRIDRLKTQWTNVGVFCFPQIYMTNENWAFNVKLPSDAVMWFSTPETS